MEESATSLSERLVDKTPVRLPEPFRHIFDEAIVCTRNRRRYPPGMNQRDFDELTTYLPMLEGGRAFEGFPHQRVPGQNCKTEPISFVMVRP